MDSATVKNLIIKGADYRSNQYGGILAAQAKNSTIQNVTIIDSSCKVASLGAIVGLITTGGLYGGALVGYADNTKIYNCESRNTSVYVDTTGGVQALGGDGMYMGGLVGWMDNGSILEYSRVVGGTVSTEYYVAGGALAANMIYAGGLVGRIDGSDSTITQVLDCFSSANVNYDGQCYVSVGAGLSGYAGGIAARISGSNYKMERCHFAGNLSGYLLNSILVLPIIGMQDYYLGGVAGQVDNLGGIQNCYFNWKNATKDNDYPGGPKVPAVWGESNNGNMNAIGDAQYSNPTFFVNFDFDGTVMRKTGNNEPFNIEHPNKWVIDPANNMPVHGSAVQAEIDFPGAGMISFAATSIQGEQKTNGLSDGSSELANGTTITQIAQTHAEMKEELTLTATVEPGYNFKGWYLKDSETSDPISTESVLKLGGTEENSYQYEDGDVFVAKYTANITFEDTDYPLEEYSYQQILDLSEKIPTLNGYLFLGWVKEPISQELDKDHLTPDNVDSFEYMEELTPVTGCLNLYPVFISVANSNVSVQMQSWELVTENNDDKKFGQEGEAKILTDPDGDIYITVEEKADIKDNEEYRFAGWYDITDDPNGKLVSQSKTYYLTNVDLNLKHKYEARYQYKVEAYTPLRGTPGYLKYIEDGASYLGDFYFSYGANVNSEKVIPVPGFYSKEVIFAYWTDESTINDLEILNQIDWDKMEDEAKKSAPNIIIKQPTKVYAIVDWNYDEAADNYYRSAIAKTDFPLATEEIKIIDAYPADHNISNDTYKNGWVTASIKLRNGYKLKGFREYISPNEGESWTVYDTATLDELKLVNNELSWQAFPGYHTSSDTVLMAQISADINMYYLNEDNNLENEVIERKYNSLLFNTDSEGNFIETQNWDESGEQYKESPYYKIPDTSPVGSGNTIAREDMYKENCKFLGWIELTEESGTVLFNTSDPEIIASMKFITNNASKVSGYLLPDEYKVKKTMSICPVYEEYDVEVNTTFGDATGESPYKPVILKEITNDGTLILTPDNKKEYNIIGWNVKVGEQETDLQLTLNNEGKYTLSGLKCGIKYEITAIYTADVSFKHANGENESKDIPYENGEPVGEIINELVPKKKVNNEESTIGVGGSSQGTTSKVFIGWNGYKVTTDKTNPDSIDYSSEEFTGFADKNTLINEATDMIPVYTVPNITLESDLEESPAKITISQTGMVTLDASISEENKGYIFTGWEKDGERFVDETVYTLSPEDLREQHTYTACYDVVITYKIPVVNKDSTTEENYTNVTDTISYGQALNGNYSIEAMTAAKKAFDQTADKAFTGNWSTEENGTSIYTGTEAITEPLYLYPISTEAVIITYKIPKADKDGKVVIENGKPVENYEDFITNIPVGFALKDGYDDEAKLQVETRMLNSDYMFTGDWIEQGDDKPYDRTTAIETNITLYPILKEAVTITYKIPAADNTTGKAVIDNDGKSTNGYDDFKVRIPKGETISDTYDKEASLEVAEVLEDTGWVFTGDWTEIEGSEEVYGIVNGNVELYPILKKGDYISIYSNISDTPYKVGMVTDGDNLILPNETVLLTTTECSLRGATGIDGRTVTPQFVGYSFVTVNKDGTHTSNGLYKATTTIDKTELMQYFNDTTDDTYRIYAVWAQVEMIPDASVYITDTQSGLFTATAVNTEILSRAGLQNGSTCFYDRYTQFSKGSKSIESKPSKTAWNNGLYRSYFDNSFKENPWFVYGSLLYNIKDYTAEYGVSSYIKFSYTTEGSCTIYDADSPKYTYTLQGISYDLLKKLETDPNTYGNYTWAQRKTLLEEYAKELIDNN